MRFWERNITKRFGERVLMTEEGKRIIGLCLSTDFTPSQLAARFDASLEEIKEFLKHPDVEAKLKGESPCDHVRVERAVRCVMCGHRIRIVPCLICRARNAPEKFSALPEIGDELLDRWLSTQAFPGTTRKIMVLRERVEKQQPLWHPEDAKWPENTPARMMGKVHQGADQQ